MKENSRDALFPAIPSDGLTLSLTVSFPSWLNALAAGLFAPRNGYRGKHARPHGA